MYESQASLSSVASSKFGVDSDDEDSSEIDRYGFTVKDGVVHDLHVTVQKNRERELKWVHMLANWRKYRHSKKNQTKLKHRVRKGIPDSLRGRAWMFLSGGEVLKKASATGKLKDEHNETVTFAKLDTLACGADEEEQIEKDLHRQFPDHEMFRNKGSGKQDLYRVLKAWAVYRPKVGYCQGQAPIASLLLMHLTAEDAFWSLVAICDYFIPGYYDVGLTAIQMDGLVLEAMTRHYCSDIHKLLTVTKVESMYYMTDWFMCIFIRTLPWNTVLRVFDLFLSEGVKVLFRVGLTMLRENLTPISKKLKGKNGDDLFMDTMAAAKKSPVTASNEDDFIREICSCRITERELTQEYKKQEKSWDKSKGDVIRNYHKRLPDDIYYIDMPSIRTRNMSRTINPISADADLASKGKLKNIPEAAEEDNETLSQSSSRWVGVSSVSYVNSNNSSSRNGKSHETSVVTTSNHETRL